MKQRRSKIESENQMLCKYDLPAGDLLFVSILCIAENL
jgi:hypothetical protein